MNLERPVRAAMRLVAVAVSLVLLAVLLPGGALLPEALGAQATAEARQMRHFWHVFAAYAIAWVLIFAWLVSILRRIRRLEDRLEG